MEEVGDKEAGLQAEEDLALWSYCHGYPLPIPQRESEVGWCPPELEFLANALAVDRFPPQPQPYDGNIRGLHVSVGFIPHQLCVKDKATARSTLLMAKNTNFYTCAPGHPQP